MSGAAEERRHKRIDDEEEDAAPTPTKRSKKQSKGEDIDDVLMSDEDDHEEEEEAEESDGEEDESASEAASGSDEEEGGGPKPDGYDDKLYGDAEDRARLEAMTSFEREQILFERGEKRASELERYEATKQQRAQRKAEKSKKKSKKKSKRASKSKKSKEKKPSSRRGGEKRSARDALADLLARKGHKLTNKASEATRERLEAEDEDEEASEEEGGSSRKRRRKSSRRDRDDAYASEEDVKDVAEANADAAEEEESRIRTPVQFVHIKGLQLRRLALEKIIDEPHFSQLVKDFIVRINVGAKDNGIPAYRLCQVVGTEDWKGKYKFGDPPRDVKTALRLKFGKAERVFTCALVSNQSITPDEFEKWRGQMEADGLTMMSAEDTARIKRRAAHLRSTFEYSPQVLAKIIEERRNAGKTISRSSNLTAEKARLLFELNQARDSGQMEAAARIQRQLDECQEAELRLMQLSQQSKSVATAHGILAINARNVAENTSKMEDMMKMMREEKKAAIEAERKAQQEGGEAYTPAPVKRDAFKRKETRPTMEFIADAEAVAAKTKAALELEKAVKEEQKAKADAEARLQEERAKRNKLEHFDDDLMLEGGSGIELQIAPGQVSNSRTLRLPHHPSVGEKLLALLRDAHKRIGPLLIDEGTSEPTTGLSSVLGRFTTIGGGADAPMEEEAPPAVGTRIFSLQDYLAEIGQA